MKWVRAGRVAAQTLVGCTEQSRTEIQLDAESEADCRSNKNAEYFLRTTSQILEGLVNLPRTTIKQRFMEQLEI
ncbi:hypothetical protein ILYODFUR_026561 [Ilyodon furcidens]|uniref:Uncharacterized protein n=1 Tax=Ilyodon furcidens TaxID=33524 RepID=A0ABV0V713_9TELE